MAKLGLDEQEPDTRPAQWGNPVQNIPAISGILGSRGILFHCDAAQAPCAMDMGKLAAHADLVSLSGHKMYGPQGIGALYIRRDLQPSITTTDCRIRWLTVLVHLRIGDLGKTAAALFQIQFPRRNHLAS